MPLVILYTYMNFPGMFEHTVSHLLRHVRRGSAKSRSVHPWSKTSNLHTNFGIHRSRFSFPFQWCYFHYDWGRIGEVTVRYCSETIPRSKLNRFRRKFNRALCSENSSKEGRAALAVLIKFSFQQLWRADQLRPL